jgi:hypothetical protein
LWQVVEAPLGPTTYALDCFDPCKNFNGPVDKDSNHQIPHTKFHQAPLLEKLVDTFSDMLQYLTIDMVWLIVKSSREADFRVGTRIST